MSSSVRLIDELWYTVFQFLPARCLLLYANRVCKEWKKLTEDPRAWHTVVLGGRLHQNDHAGLVHMLQSRRWSLVRRLSITRMPLQDVHLTLLPLFCPKLEYLELEGKTVTDFVMRQAVMLLAESDQQQPAEELPCEEKSAAAAAGTKTPLTVVHYNWEHSACRQQVNEASAVTAVDLQRSFAVQPSVESGCSLCTDAANHNSKTEEKCADEPHPSTAVVPTPLNTAPHPSSSSASSALASSTPSLPLRKLPARLYRFRGLTSLKHLSLAGCRKVGDPSINAIAAGCPNLESLDLSLCLGITESGLKTMAKCCAQLRDLYLLAVRAVNDSVLECFSKHLTQLRRLKISSCACVSDGGMRHIGRLVTLEHLDIVSCWAISDAGVEVIANGCRNLKSLAMGHLPAITDQAIASVANSLVNLEFLDIRKCSRLSPSALGLLAKSPIKLRLLNAYYCKFKDASFLPCVRSQTFRSVQHLNLTAQCITDTALIALASASPLLKTLNLSYCYDIADEGIRAVACSCPQLESLNLTMCRGVTTKSMRYLEFLPLQSLVLSFCNVDDSTLQHLAGLASGSPLPSNGDTSQDAAGSQGHRPVTPTGKAQYSITGWESKEVELDPLEPELTHKLSYHLTELNLYHCTDVTDQGVLYISCAFRALSTLVLSECNKITQKGFKDIASGCHRLTLLKASGTQMTLDAINDLHKGCPRWNGNGAESIIRRLKQDQNNNNQSRMRRFSNAASRFINKLRRR